MDFTRINIIAYKTVCAICCLTAAIIGLKILSDLLFVKGLFALFAAAMFGLLFFQKPLFRTWLQVAVVVVATYWMVTQLAKF